MRCQERLLIFSADPGSKLQPWSWAEHFSFLLSACSRVASLQGYSEYSKIFQGIPRILEDLGGFSCFIFIYFPSLWPYVSAVKMLRLGTKGRMLLPRSDFGVFWLASKFLKKGNHGKPGQKTRDWMTRDDEG